MKKIWLLIILICSTISFYGCNKKSNEDLPVSLYSIDISSLSNQQILNIIQDENLQEGVYNIVTSSNNYLFFNGINSKYEEIVLSLNDKILTINCKNSTSSENTKKLYIIKEKSSTSYNSSEFYNSISLKVNDKNANLILFTIK